MIVMFAVLVSIPSCRTVKEVPTERVVNRTEFIDRIMTDSVYCHDSVYIRDAGDTIYLYKDKYVYKYKFVHDTAFVSHTDSIPYVVEVEKSLTRYESLQMRVGKIMIPVILILICIVIGYIIRKIV